MVNQRFSFQREQIYQIVTEREDHPTAEMVYTTLKPRLPRLSLGTVYRNLRQMAQEGRLVELDGPTVRFDANTAPHSHLRCTRCGALLDLDVPYDPDLDRQAAARGYAVTGHSLLFNGICPACAGEKNTASEFTI